MTKGKSAKRPVGSPPIWTDLLRDEFGLCYYVILEQLDRAVKTAKETPQDSQPYGLIAYVRALCCLLRSHPLWPRNARFEKWQVAEWKELILNNLETSKKRIPPKFRDEYSQEILNDLEFLEEFMNRKRDPKTDL